MWSAAFKIEQVSTSFMILIMYRVQVLYVLVVLYLPELLDVLCLLKVIYFRFPIGLTVSRRIPSSTAKNCFLPLRVKNADFYLTVVNF